MAQDYKQALDAAGICGPYRLGGHCNGALIALELAHQLEAEGRKVELVAMIDALSLNTRPSMRLVARTLQTVLDFVVRDTPERQARFESTMSWVWRIVRTVVYQPEPRRPLLLSLIWRAAHKAKRVLYDRREASRTNDKVSSLAAELREKNWSSTKESVELLEVYHQRMAGYIPMPVAARLLSIVSESNSQSVEFSGQVWRNFTTHSEVVVVPGDHLTCVTTYAEALTDHLRERLAALDRDQVPELSPPMEQRMDASQRNHLSGRRRPHELSSKNQRRPRASVDIS
jgi:thioesterase domain-containing protein